MSKAFKNLKMFLFLSACWTLLSETYTLHMFLNMAVSNILIIVLGNRLKVLPNIRITSAGLSYSLVLAKNILVSSLFVLNLFKKERPEYRSGTKIVSFKNIKTDLKATLHAAAITMTPGTTVLAIDKTNNTMLIHGLDSALLEEAVDEKITSAINK